MEGVWPVLCYQPPAMTSETLDKRTALLPRLLANGRNQAATVPVPKGWLAGMTLFPAHPLLRASGAPTAFDAARYEAFQSLMKRYGDPALVAGKQDAFATSGEVKLEEAEGETRRRALGVRIGQRQLRWLQAAAGERIVAKS